MGMRMIERLRNDGSGGLPLHGERERESLRGLYACLLRVDGNC